MDSFYFLCSLIGIGWLVIWSVQAEKKSGGWSPFDMRISREKPTLDVRQRGRKCDRSVS
jgi:hypothetical protein